MASTYIEPSVLIDDTCFSPFPARSAGKKAFFLNNGVILFSKAEGNYITDISYRVKRHTDAVYGNVKTILHCTSADECKTSNTARFFQLKSIKLLSFLKLWLSANGFNPDDASEWPDDLFLVQLYNFPVDGEFDSGESYDFLFEVEDSSGNNDSCTVDVYVPAGARIFDFGNRPGGSRDFHFYVPVTSDGIITAPQLHAIGAAGGSVPGTISGEGIYADSVTADYITSDGISDGLGGTVSISAKGDIKCTDNDGNTKAVLSPSGDISADGDVSAGGNISADGDVSAGGNISADGNISSSGNIEASGVAVGSGRGTPSDGHLYAGYIVSDGGIHANGDVSALGDVSASGNISASNGIGAGGDIQAYGSIIATSAKIGSGYSSSMGPGDVSVYGDILLFGPDGGFHSLKSILGQLGVSPF